MTEHLVPEASPASDQSASPLRLRVDIFTLFPGMFAGPFDESIIHRARARGLIEIALHDIRDWTADRHRSVDDTPYGGGAGMVMMAPPVVEAVESILGVKHQRPDTRIVILSPAGRLFDQSLAAELARSHRLVLICGHYEGIDDRVGKILGAEELSIGDYVLTGGELAAMVLIDAVARLVPGVIADASMSDESHVEDLVEYPHYTRPFEYRGLSVPAILLSGHHANIARWRRDQSLLRTALRRPDLIERADLSDEEVQLIHQASKAQLPDDDGL